MVHVFGFDQRQQRELDSGRITTRVRDEARLPDTLAIHLRKPIQLRRRARRGVRDLVPLLPGRAILEAEVGGEIHDLRPRLEQGACLAHRHAVGRSKEDAVATLEQRVRRIGTRDRSGDAAREVVRHLHARLRARSDGCHLHTRMTGQQAQQFTPVYPVPPTTPTLIKSVSQPTRIEIPERQSRGEAALCQGFLPASASAFRELLAASRLVQADFLALDLARVARHSPAFESAGLSVGSYSIRARVMPWRTAPACPDSPPPNIHLDVERLQVIGELKGLAHDHAAGLSREKDVDGLSFTVMLPLPGLMNTRATAFLRRPVP